jgi:uncharacterized protein
MDCKTTPIGVAERDQGLEISAWTAVVVALVILVVSLVVAVGAARAILGLAPLSSQVDAPLISLIEVIVGQILIVILIGGASARLRGGALKWLSLDQPAGGAYAYLACLSIMLMTVVVYTALLYFIVDHDLQSDLKPFLAILKGPWWWLALVAFGLGAPVSEEVMFRGFLQTALEKTWLGFWGSAIATSAFWTLLHYKYSFVGLTQVFVIGILFSAFLFRTGSLRVPLFCHATYNIGLVLVARWIL